MPRLLGLLGLSAIGVSCFLELSGSLKPVYLSCIRVDTMVGLLDMDRVKRSGSMEQRLVSLEEQVG